MADANANVHPMCVNLCTDRFNVRDARINLRAKQIRFGVAVYSREQLGWCCLPWHSLSLIG